VGSEVWGRAALALTLAGAVALGGCNYIRKKKPEITYEERPVEALYQEGASRLDRRQWENAVVYFREVERQHPYSEWSRRAILMTAFAHYQANQYDEAIAAADRFIQLYPGNPSTPYAYYLKAQCYFERIVDVGRDQSATQQALAALRDVVQRYPNTDYAQDARLKIDMVNDQLAGKEMTIGRWYLRNGQPIAAMGRFKAVIDRYQTTSHTPEALYRMVEASITLGLFEEAKRNAAVLGANYPSSGWYRSAYNLMTSRDLRPAQLPEGEPRRRGILERLKIG
jgi:outer membrane protein assembly factor BamD